MLGLLASSGCQLNRNGTWYDAPRAMSHLKMVRRAEWILANAAFTDEELASFATGCSSSDVRTSLAEGGRRLQ